MKSLRRLSANVLLTVLSVAGTLAVAEITWSIISESGDKGRVFSDTLRFVNPPNAEWTIRKEEYTTSIRTNSLGFRGPEMPAEPKAEDELRILFLGDSFVEAKQVQEQDRFVEQSAALLADALHKNVTTRALAVGGSNPALALLYYRTIGRDFHPDIVVHVLFPENDLLPMEGPYTLEPAGNDLVLTDIWVEPPPPCAWKCKVLKHSTLARHLYHGLRKQNTDSKTAAETLGDYYWYTRQGQYDVLGEGRMQVLRALIKTLRTDVETDGATLLVALMPGALEIQNNWREEYIAKQEFPKEYWEVHGLLRMTDSILRKDGFHILNLRTVFEKSDPDTDPLYLKNDPHLSLKGHRITAESLAETIRKLL
ncbi:hypothetical protein COU78_05705 [Candidatus Peregrinibacteria bacterium CG10_big_fil_rev_8_21_14_0_10_49_24]|nr:MAG: hypothetical protein COV83_03490 [Candidatus Peregrinibacteria bacterium CG11_big_fil_rev_8_21_14_0_20_49_14]PIR50621.1 MAG: hypothetical protein COU78_05705 [Candidatus Peregrinibacteria bacterium CG10_big_fil_rev_8_21_14_0_10_49_24]PJA67061.1 MAG: hypothetical protein CO157_06400 [Candidatus Peregrinibacteria bacterium CG_4_9_14_3_um_filter_49_12]